MKPRQPYELGQSRRMLARDTLTPKLSANLVDLQVAVGLLEGSEIFEKDERELACAIIDLCEENQKLVGELFNPVTRFGDRYSSFVYRADNLQEEIARLRECAFWLLDPAGVRRLEGIISARLQIYDTVRSLIKILQTKDAEITQFRDPEALPDFGPSPYLRLLDQIHYN